MGVLVGSISTRQDHVVGICVLVSLLMAALGGCWWPIEVAPRVLQQAAILVPTGWAMSALHQLISLGNGIRQVLPQIARLVGFAAAANLLAGRFFRV
ncbi:MAG: ABC transporter permease [Sedimentisphaerales bacterium]|nr:ABC transporter permease [Sedimentisphaerales bacterium]